MIRWLTPLLASRVWQVFLSEDAGGIQPRTLIKVSFKPHRTHFTTIQLKGRDGEPLFSKQCYFSCPILNGIYPHVYGPVDAASLRRERLPDGQYRQTRLQRLLLLFR